MGKRKSTEPTVPMKDYIDLHAKYQEKLRDANRKDIDSTFADLRERHSDALKMLFSRFEAISDRFNASEGKDKGIAQFWGWIVGAAAVLGLVIEHFSMK